MEEERKYLIVSYVMCMAALAAFTSYAVISYTLHLFRQKHDQDAVEFITARGTQSKWRIMYSFFASAVGAWCLVAPSQFAIFTGIVGLAMYAFSAGFPILLVALFGNRIQAMHPDVVSISDFAGKRFGPVFRSVVVLVALLNMAIGTLAEYTTMGSLFKDFVGSVNYPVIIVVGVLTMSYTAYGGLYISILTDQIQAMLTILFIAILSIFVAATFREPLETPLPESLGPNRAGYSAIFSMPCSLLAATVMSEAFWQKVWAGADQKAVRFGGIGASMLVSCAVFLFGFAGWLASWGGLVVWDYDEEGSPVINPNLYLFQVFKTADANDGTGDQPARVRSWIGVVALMMAITMNASAVDSYQSGINASFTSHFFRDQHVLFSRTMVLLVNIPLMIVALQGYPILSLFLITNMLTTCCFLPMLSGILGGAWPSTKRYAWYGNVNYEWHYFLTAAGSSVVGMLLWAGCAYLIRRTTGWEGPGVSAVMQRLPGFHFITGGGIGVDLLACITRGRHTYHAHGTAGDVSKPPVSCPGLNKASDSDNGLDSSPTKVALQLESLPPSPPAVVLMQSKGQDV
ncbi:uncharacterized protein HaLaN_09825 [Haematococcus lacustris]|uniref:Uncharacterized protein n=1 Tax=Haematococcus lacustris TaxID=44745 RepID=A0A699YUF7_HAELA|nr:uncharacterized protein HaLaN_09825 [Haematococcus lacustris]